MESEKTQICNCTVIHAETVEAVGAKMPEDKNLNMLSELFKNFADGTRIKILWALSISEMCVCDLTSMFDMTISAVSHQLKFLRNSDLVKFRKEGKVVYYSLSDSHVKTILKQGFDHISHISHIKTEA